MSQYRNKMGRDKHPPKPITPAELSAKLGAAQMDIVRGAERERGGVSKIMALIETAMNAGSLDQRGQSMEILAQMAGSDHSKYADKFLELAGKGRDDQESPRARIAAMNAAAAVIGLAPREAGTVLRDFASPGLKDSSPEVQTAAVKILGAVVDRGQIDYSRSVIPLLTGTVAADGDGAAEAKEAALNVGSALIQKYSRNTPYADSMLELAAEGFKSGREEARMAAAKLVGNVGYSHPQKAEQAMGALESFQDTETIDRVRMSIAGEFAQTARNQPGLEERAVANIEKSIDGGSEKGGTYEIGAAVKGLQYVAQHYPGQASRVVGIAEKIINDEDVHTRIAATIALGFIIGNADGKTPGGSKERARDIVNGRLETEQNPQVRARLVSAVEGAYKVQNTVSDGSARSSPRSGSGFGNRLQLRR
ncbi:MAG: hypothetical protein WDO70_10825 [Alphaproteobacteria bacterium]